MRPKFFIIISAVFFLFIGCRKQPLNNLSAEESRVYITNWDATVNFAVFNTFSIADNVLVIDGNSTSFGNLPADAAFIEAFQNQMELRGFTRVSRDNNPDLGIQINRIIRTSTGIIAFPDYWGFWDPFFWGIPGAGWGFPPFWGIGTYQVREGLLSADLVDLKNVGENNNQIRVIWNGIIRGSGIFNANTANSQVEQLFEQSPYIRAN